MTDESEAEDDGLRGPWLLALGVGLVGIVAVTVEGVRKLRGRLRQDDEHGT